MVGRRWTEDEVDYLEWYVLSREEHDLTQACKFLDRSYKAVRSKLAKLQKHNPNLQFKPKWSDADDSYILKYYQRFSYKTLARILGRSEKAIRDRIRKLGKRKILDLTIFHKDVVSLANQGMAVKDIAQKLGLHYNQAYYYLNKHQIPYKKQEFRNQSNNLAKGKSEMEAHRWCSAVEYLLRYKEKNGLEDLKKARKNLDWLIEEMEHEN